MPPRPPPLITRLRQRVQAVAWLGVLAMLFKFALATACAGDGLASQSIDGSVVSAAALAGDALDAECWHAGATGCHCHCLHASALPLSPPVVVACPPCTEAPAMRLPHLLLTPREPALRPPIA